MLAAAGCGTAPTPTAGPPTAGSPTSAPANKVTTSASSAGTDIRQAVTVHRTGGLVGVDQTLVVTADGRWVFGKQTGRLTADQQSTLQALLSSPKLAAEARLKPSGVCNDGFDYTLTTARVGLHYTDCGGPDRPPTAVAIVELLSGATPL
jgi:hypothetical protein